MTTIEREMWDEWCDNSITLTWDNLKKYLGPKPSKVLLREYLYSVGIRPDEFLLQTHTGDYWYGRTSRIFEIRFVDGTTLALFKIALQ